MGIFSKKKTSPVLQDALKGQDPPVFPERVLRLLKLLRDPDAEIAQIAEALSWDPGLVVRTLRTVNSAAFGVNQKIECVEHGISMLGRTQLEHLILGVAVKRVLPNTTTPGFESKRFWQAAFFRAALARALADQIHPQDRARSFTGGLLQDMAVPLLAQARPQDYGPVLQMWHGERDMQLHQLEKEALGWSHDEIGAQLGIQWELPENLTQIIQAHHDSTVGDQELPPALRLVAVHRETEIEHGIERIVEDARSLYGIKPDWLQQAMGDCQKQATELSLSMT